MHVARAVQALRPCLIVIENVRGLLISPARPAGDVEPCPWCVGDDPVQPPVRALGAVLGSLADLRYDTRWLVLRASDIGAPHRRERVFLAAWPTHTPAQDPDIEPRQQRRLPAPRQEDQRRTRAEPGRRGRMAPPHPESVGRSQGLAEPTARQRRPDPSLRGSFAAPHPEAEQPPHARTAFGEEPTAPKSGDGTAAVAGHVTELGADSGPWGPYAAAITRWETLTRPAPAPTDPRGRLQPEFVEWMQGLPPGWVTATPVLSRPAQLTALGNGVIPQQATQALRLLAPPFPHCPNCARP
jgi:DNA (cytosine-5)-methyltransferase 1